LSSRIIGQPAPDHCGQAIGGCQGDVPLGGDEPAEHRAVDVGVAGQLVE
jgi:hypothetical protein